MNPHPRSSRPATARTMLRPALWSGLAGVLLLAGCASPPRHTPNPERFPETFPSGHLDFRPTPRPAAAALPIEQRMAATDVGAPRLYSFRANGQSLRVTLAQFAAAYNLNIIADADIAGTVAVEFRDLSLERALDALLDPIGVGWVREDGLIRVTRQVTRTWQVDYLRANRSGIGAAGGDAINFWSELESEVRALMTRANTEGVAADRLTETVETPGLAGAAPIRTTRAVPEIEGRIVVNRTTGTVVITGSPRALRAVESFMERLLARINRQVFIEARVLDVTLRDSQALGIDWTRVQFNGSLVAATSGIVTAPMGGAGVSPPTLRLDYTRNFPGSYLVRNLAAAVQALEEQGAVRVVSQPRIRTLNNQPAVVRVGTERTFFTTESTLTPVPGGAPTITTTDTANTVTEGVTLTVTPQIGNDGMITLDVRPVINRVTGTVTSPSGLSNAPIMDTQETMTLVRMRSGETVVIGGLIMEEDADTSRGVPGAIAARQTSGLGWLFGGQQQSNNRRELVVFFTAHLVEH